MKRRYARRRLSRRFRRRYSRRPAGIYLRNTGARASIKLPSTRSKDISITKECENVYLPLGMTTTETTKTGGSVAGFTLSPYLCTPGQKIYSPNLPVTNPYVFLDT